MKIVIKQRNRFEYNYYYLYEDGNYKEWMTNYWPYIFKWTAKLAAKRAIRKLNEGKKYPIVVEEFEYSVVDKKK